MSKQKQRPAKTGAARSKVAQSSETRPGGRIAGRAGKNSDFVYDDLRREIVSMRLRPGAPVLERELTTTYGVSRTPVREALLRLADEGLVDVAPKHGTFVSRIPISSLREALVARRALEEVTVRGAAALADRKQLAAAREIIAHQHELAETGDEETFHDSDDDFHAALAAMARYPGIWNIIKQIRVQVERYRRLTLPQDGRMLLVAQEHESVLDAIAAGQADKAVARMDEHLDKLQLDISIFRDIWPDYFICDLELEDIAPGRAATKRPALTAHRS